MSFDHLFAGIVKTRFEPSLDVRRRSEILALLRRGIKPSVLSRMYSVNRHTVHAIGRDSSAHYRGIRREYQETGRDLFEAKYLTEELIKEALALQRGDAEAKPGGLRPDPVKPTVYNRRANTHAGQQFTTDAFDIELELRIEWCRPVDGQPEAWYYQEAGSDGWAGPYFTSSSALRGAKESKTQGELDG